MGKSFRDFFRHSSGRQREIILGRLRAGPATRWELVAAMQEAGLVMDPPEFTNMLISMEWHNEIQSYISMELDGKVEVYRKFYRIA